MDSLPASMPVLQPLYRRLANHYLDAIKAGSLVPGDRMPSVRGLMRLHDVSLSTALQVCRQLESEGWLEARPRSGYFVQERHRVPLAAIEEPSLAIAPDAAQYVGIHEQVSNFYSKGQQFPARINLAGARGAPELYPAEQLKNAAIRALRRKPKLLVSVVTHTGNAQFKSVLAKRAISIGLTISPDEIIVTHGGSEAIHLALRAIAQAGDTIAVESPTYYGLLQVLETLGMRALEIPTSPQTGISIEALQLAMQTYPNIKAVIAVPNLQNPLGSIMPDSHKSRLVALCEQHGVPLIEDDTYSDLAEGEARLLAAKAWDRTGNVIYCASLNKILAPGMRLGWMLGGRWHARIAMLKFAQMRQNEEWSQLTAAEFMGSAAYERHLRRLRHSLRTQRELTAQAIANYFPIGTRLSMPDGGTALWVELPQRLSSERVFNEALQQGIMIAPGSIFSNSNRFDHFIRINCGIPYSPALDQALRRLGDIVTALVNGKSEAGIG